MLESELELGTTQYSASNLLVSPSMTPSVALDSEGSNYTVNTDITNHTAQGRHHAWAQQERFPGDMRPTQWVSSGYPSSDSHCGVDSQSLEASYLGAQAGQQLQTFGYDQLYVDLASQQRQQRPQASPQSTLLTTVWLFIVQIPQLGLWSDKLHAHRHPCPQCILRLMLFD